MTYMNNINNNVKYTNAAMNANVNANINIVYPIAGETYPRTDPTGRCQSSYFTASFSTSYGGGGFAVKWGFNKETLGSGEFYDQMSAQFVWKLPEGKHTFWVVSSICERKEVEFFIG